MFKRVLFVTLSIIFFIGVLYFFRYSFGADISKPNPEVMGEEVSERKRIAICPTMNRIISKEGVYRDYDFVSVSSTSDGVLLLNKEDVDYVVSGRIPKPEENISNYTHLRETLTSYSFMGMNEEYIFNSDLKSYQIYTDLEVEDILQKFEIEEINYVEDVYEYVKEGILITSWDNTDYTKASIVHIMGEDGSRNLLSRLPTVFCMKECIQEDVSKLKELFKI